MILSLEDRIDISDVLVRYATDIDRRDWKLFRTCFTADCLAEYGDIGTWHGVEELTAFMELAHSAAGHTQHSITNQTITATDTGAAARCYVDSIVMGGDGVHGVQAVGFYDDELRRADSGWRIARRQFTAVLMREVSNISLHRSV